MFDKLLTLERDLNLQRTHQNDELVAKNRRLVELSEKVDLQVERSFTELIELRQDFNAYVDQSSGRMTEFETRLKQLREESVLKVKEVEGMVTLNLG